jgi:hypothetical protein
MRWPHWFRDKNSLILEYDHLDDRSVDMFHQQIEEVGNYYKFVGLSEIGISLQNKKSLGTAAVIFKNPRKSVLLRAIPFLIDKRIPFTLFLRTDCVGLNRLPPEEEFDWIERNSSKKLEEERRSKFFRLCWENPLKVDEFLKGIRSELGPMPVEKLDPTIFFSTWGKLLEVPQELVTWGMTLYTAPDSSRYLEDEILFMRRLLGRAPEVGKVGSLATLVEANNGWNEASLSRLALLACVGNLDGAVTHSNSRWDLPVWRFST